MHRTITGVLRKIREIETSSIGVETLRGYNLYKPPDCNPKTRDHKQASIFVELAEHAAAASKLLQQSVWYSCSEHRPRQDARARGRRGAMRGRGAASVHGKTNIEELKNKMTENPYDNFEWKSLLTLMAPWSVMVVRRPSTRPTVGQPDNTAVYTRVRGQSIYNVVS
jgi:hypothetical protein